MEKTTVTFTGEKRTITLDFDYNSETGDLDYNTTVEPPFESEEQINDGSLVVFLANTLLSALTPGQEFTESEI